ncbi:secreted RxLR effector protein 78-like [Arachis hypogaea]|uniref:secreted RxLR effector protein 78-like n=1 Tax=Arachis hypogaea TaxID=3818 RepID=UPI003B215B72
MAIKIDLEKAYDRLKWSFIHDTLLDMGIPPHIIYLIHCCITSVEMRVLWNGKVLDKFSPSKGVRQGDSISPYIFISCIECLSHSSMLRPTMVFGNVSILKGVPPDISHLCFADDLILSAKANLKQADIINK